MLRSKILCLVLSIGALSLAPDLIAQERSKPSSGSDLRFNRGGQGEPLKVEPNGRKRDSDDEDAEFLDPNAPRNGLSRHADLRASIRPRRLAPGQTGTAIFYVAMRPLYAGLADERFQVRLSPDQGYLSFGPAVVSEPTSRSEDPDLVGLTVYDDLIRIEAPVTVSQDAPYGTYPGGVQVQVPIQVRRGGRFQGVLQGIARVQVVVGEALPSFVPSEQGGSDEPVRVPGQDGREALEAESVRSQGGESSVRTGPLAERFDAADRAVQAGPVDVADLPEDPDEGGGDFLIYGGAAVLVLLAGAVLFSGRKR